jgi:hypothetical protein
MEQSIESLWKTGFIAEDALVAPHLNNLYNKKSMSIIEKFKRMLTINTWAIFFGSLLVLAGGISFKVPLAGIIIFVLLQILVGLSVYYLRQLKTIEYGTTSLDYLKSFKNWLDQSFDTYGKFYRIFYPVFFPTFILGMAFANIESLKEGSFYARYMAGRTDFELFGIPVWLLMILVTVTITAFLFGQKIYELDVKSIYGPIMRKLDTLLNEMNELEQKT